MEPRLSSLPAGLVPVPLCVGQGRGEGQQWRAPSHCPLPFLRKRLRLCREPQSRRGRSRHGQLEERGPGARATLRPGARAGPRAVQQTGPGLPSARAQPGTGTRTPARARPQVRAAEAGNKRQGGRSMPKGPAWKGWSLQPRQEGQVAHPNGCQRGQNKVVREAQTRGRDPGRQATGEGRG